MESLPTTVIGLIAFITAGNVAVAMAFISYIKNKNGHMERMAELFGVSMKDARDKFEGMLEQQSERHEKVLSDANSRLDRCMAA